MPFPSERAPKLVRGAWGSVRRRESWNGRAVRVQMLCRSSCVSPLAKHQEKLEISGMGRMKAVR